MARSKFAYAITIDPDPIVHGQPLMTTAVTDCYGWMLQESPTVRGWQNLAPGTSTLGWDAAQAGTYKFTITDLRGRALYSETFTAV